MTKEEGKRKRRKKLSGNQAGNRSSAEQEESSKQLEEEKEENMQAGTANEAGNKRGRGRTPLPPPSAEATKIKKAKKNKRDRDYRANKKSEFIRLKKWQDLFVKFCEKQGITEQFNAFCEEHEEKVEEKRKFCEELGMASEALWEDVANKQSDKETQMILENFSKDPWATLEENLGSEMIPTWGPEGITAVNSSRFGAGPSNVDWNSGGEWQSSTTLITGGVANSSSAGGHGGRGLGDFHVSLAAINPLFQTANTGTNNVNQEDNIGNRENKAAEADNSGIGADATSGSWYPWIPPFFSSE